MKTEDKKVRCAIYTRKSATEGLDMDFNTLDAQREAALNYIASQKQEGWIALDKLYDDGGFTGGNMDRPALKELFEDIKNGKIDMVVVYKVDRLSRSLTDFAKIVELFDTYKVSFVSVTQHFNTKDSMGRLTLNILLSFAQFEREIISERTRDKIAAARKRGKWIGGIPILGYDMLGGGKGITVNEVESKQVRDIFNYYLECRSISQTVEYLNKKNIRCKQWRTCKGVLRGGGTFSKTTLWNMINNMTYIGKVKFEDKIYEAEFEGIVDEEIFNKAQKLLKENACDKSPAVRNKYNALLAGKVYCGHCGTVMGHSYTKKTATKVYRYYICGKAVKTGWKNCPYPSLPAAEIEEFIVEELVKIGNDKSVLTELIESFNKQNCSDLSENAKYESSLKRSLKEMSLKISKCKNDSLEIADLRKQEVLLVDALDGAKTERTLILNRIETGELELRNLFSNFLQVWQNLNFKDKYEIINLLIERVTYNGKDGDIFITFKSSNRDTTRKAL